MFLHDIEFDKFDIACEDTLTNPQQDVYKRQSFYFENWQGVKQKKLKRGFATKKDALAWEREFLLQQAADLTMTFEAFVEIYITDKKKRLRENTWFTKEHIIRTKILPYFKEKRCV